MKKILVLLFLLFNFTTFGFAGEWPTVHDIYVGEVFKYPILKLHPTQPAVGMLAVLYKSERFKEMSHDELKAELKGDPVPVVAAPDGKFYMIDHHHESLAALTAGRENIWVELRNDFSKLANMTEFWAKMKEKKFVRLIDEKGKTITVDKLPKTVKKLKDDPYRALAYFARKEGAFKKSHIPFSEFVWADYYRTRVDFQIGDVDLKDDFDDYNTKKFRKSVDEAEQISHSDDAKDLPGYVKKKIDCSLNLKKNQ